MEVGSPRQAWDLDLVGEAVVKTPYGEGHLVVLGQS